MADRSDLLNMKARLEYFKEKLENAEDPVEQMHWRHMIEALENEIDNLGYLLND